MKNWSRWFLISLCLIISILITMGCCLSHVATNDEQQDRPAAANANVKLALGMLKQGFFSQAKQKLLLAQSLNPNDPAVWYSMGYYHEQIGEINLANENYQYAIQLNFNDGAAHNNYGVFLCRQGRYNESIAELLLAAQNINYVDSAISYQNAGICALRISNVCLAEKYFQKARDRDPKLNRIIK